MSKSLIQVEFYFSLGCWFGLALLSCLVQGGATLSSVGLRTDISLLAGRRMLWSDGEVLNAYSWSTDSKLLLLFHFRVTDSAGMSDSHKLLKNEVGQAGLDLHGGR